MKKSTIIVIVCLAIFIINIAITRYKYNSYINENDSNMNEEININDMAREVCYGDFTPVFVNDSFEDRGIYECNNTNYVYYIETLDHYCGLYKCGNIYEFGYSKTDEVEEYFPNEKYYFRKSGVVGIANELKLLLEAKSEEEVIENYSMKIYEFMKSYNSDDFRLFILFNDSLEGINTSYDKLILFAGNYSNNVTQSYGMGKLYGEYALYDGLPDSLLQIIYDNPSLYPSNARNAAKNNRHINLEIHDASSISFEEFKERLTNSFEENF